MLTIFHTSNRKNFYKPYTAQYGQCISEDNAFITWLYLIYLKKYCTNLNSPRFIQLWSACDILCCVMYPSTFKKTDCDVKFKCHNTRLKVAANLIYILIQNILNCKKKKNTNTQNNKQNFPDLLCTWFSLLLRSRSSWSGTCESPCQICPQDQGSLQCGMRDNSTQSPQNTLKCKLKNINTSGII